MSKPSKSAAMKAYVNEFIRQAKERGFIVQYYASHTTNSHYIKLDYGMANSIRISDHHGYKHLKYRYNILSNVRKRHMKRDEGFERFYFSMEEESITRVLDKAMKVKLSKFLSGEEAYKMALEFRKAQSAGRRGFWQYAKEI